MSTRVLLYVQHLLGIGHLMRGAHLARAFSAAGFDVDLVSGGFAVPDLPLGTARLVQLPPARSRDESFGEIVDEQGNAVDEAWRRLRRERLLQIFAERRPEVLVIEMFPFGRRQMRFELIPLLEATAASNPRPIVACSVRDIVQRRRAPDRVEETLDLVERMFDLVLVHGDPSLVRFEDSFPLVGRLARRLRYTGYVAPADTMRGKAGDPGWDEVVVSAGGGAVGGTLLATALAARRFSELHGRHWRFLVGGNMPNEAFRALVERAEALVTIERTRPDFGQILANCRVSISQAGYNTIMDIMAAGTRAVVVPFLGAGETEQELRAEKLAARGLVQRVLEHELTPHRLAAALDAADAMPAPCFSGIERQGGEASARIIAEAVAERRAAMLHRT
jgi:predicted glycosyltransferase